MIKTAAALSKALSAGELTAKAILDEVFNTIDRYNSVYNIFISLQKEKAYKIALDIDEKRQKGDVLHPLAGIPVALKDNLLDYGESTTCASKILQGFTAPYTATAVQKMANVGLIPVGRVNMDEFAMGSSTEQSVYGATKNPWDPTCVVGGSSGGSAASIAAGMVPLALGSDTGGSIRQPASFCGVVGLKPSYGRVSRYGLVAFASSLDQIGPFAKTVEDCAYLLEVISGVDPADSTSAKKPVPDFLKNLERSVKGMRIAVPRLFIEGDIANSVKETFVKSLDVLKELGAFVEVVDVGCFKEALSAYYIIAPAEASANLERYDGVRYGVRHDESKSLQEMIMKSRGQGFGKEVKSRIILGTYVLSSGYYDAYYLKAQKVRRFIAKKFHEVLSNFDCIATPTAPTEAFKLGEMLGDPLAMYYSDIATIPANLVGLPGISVPCGFSERGLPIGLQLMGGLFQEEDLLRMAHQFQMATSYHKESPEVL